MSDSKPSIKIYGDIMEITRPNGWEDLVFIKHVQRIAYNKDGKSLQIQIQGRDSINYSDIEHDKYLELKCALYKIGKKYD